MTITLKRTVNLSEPILPEVLQAPLYEGEKNAHTFIITAEKDKLPHALSGSVVAYFERNDGNTVRVEGETKDGAAILTLSPECYQTGVFYLAVMLISDGAQTVIYAASGRVRNTQDGEIIDGGNTIPTYDEIMAHLEKYLSTDITAKVEETEDGAIITMKDVVNGETKAVLKHGKDGEPGAPGVSGKSAYEIAVENGFEGTEEEWLSSFKNDEVFVIHEIESGVSDRTFDEVEAAFEAGKIVLFKDSTYGVFVCHGEGSAPNRPGERGYMFQSAIISGSNGHKLLLTTILYPPNTFEHLAEFPLTAVTENELSIKYGDESFDFDGSKAVTVDIKNDIFVVRIDSANKSDKTQAEVRAAVAAGKFPVLADENFGINAIYAGEFKDASDPSGMRPAFVSQLRQNDDATYALTYYRLKSDGYFVRNTYSPVTTPTPAKLTIKTAEKTVNFDGNSPETVDLTNLGSGGETVENVQDVFWVNISDSGSSSGDKTFDKTDAEIIAAHESGKIVLGKYEYYIWPLTGFYKGLHGVESYNITFEGWGSGGGLARLWIDNRWAVENDESSGYNRTVNFYYTDFATKYNIPITLPNPYKLTITAPDGTQVNYDGKTPQEISLKDVPWDTITDKPFGNVVALDYTISNIANFDGKIYVPFTLVEGDEYKIVSEIANQKFTFNSVAKKIESDGLIFTYLGNMAILFPDLANTGEPYILISIPGGTGPSEDQLSYGALAFDPSAFPDFSEGVIYSLHVLVENLTRFKTVPEEYIPTMSETTKGGAMVGEGLEVVDGVLRVKQAKSEILLSDSSTGKAYSIHVTNGEIILTESASVSGESGTLTLVDTETQNPYSIYISNGELMIKEATA